MGKWYLDDANFWSMPAWECATRSGPKPMLGTVAAIYPSEGLNSRAWECSLVLILFLFFFLVRSIQIVLTAHLMGEKLLLHLVHTVVLYSLISRGSRGLTKQWSSSEKPETTHCESYEQLFSPPMAKANCFEQWQQTSLVDQLSLGLFSLGCWLLGAMQLSQISSQLPCTLDYSLNLGKTFATHLCSKKSKF